MKNIFHNLYQKTNPQTNPYVRRAFQILLWSFLKVFTFEENELWKVSGRYSSSALYYRESHSTVVVCLWWPGRDTAFIHAILGRQNKALRFFLSHLSTNEDLFTLWLWWIWVLVTLLHKRFYLSFLALSNKWCVISEQKKHCVTEWMKLVRSLKLKTGFCSSGDFWCLGNKETSELRSLGQEFWAKIIYTRRKRKRGTGTGAEAQWTHLHVVFMRLESSIKS